MPALPPDDMRKLRETAFAARHPVDSMLDKWQAIEAGTARLVRLAGLSEAERPSDQAATQTRFIGALAGANEWQRELAWQAIQDVESMLQSGLNALDVLELRGKDAQIPALALWREVDAARRGMLWMLDSVVEETAPVAS
jgi:hypothetical protein